MACMRLDPVDQAVCHWQAIHPLAHGYIIQWL